MTNSRLVDLSVVLDEPVEVRFDPPPAPTYLIPAEIPVPLMLAVQAKEEERERLAKTGTDEEVTGSLFDDLHEQALALFQIHQPDMKVVPCTLQQLMRLIPTVYGGAEEAEGKPQRKTKGRTGSAKSTSSSAKRKPTRRAS